MPKQLGMDTDPSARAPQDQQIVLIPQKVQTIADLPDYAESATQ